jgi:hypothetical protein
LQTFFKWWYYKINILISQIVLCVNPMGCTLYHRQQIFLWRNKPWRLDRAVPSKWAIWLFLFSITDAFRLGKKSDKTRPILVKFASFENRDFVKKNTKKSKGSSYGISEQLPAEIMKIRKVYHLTRFRLKIKCHNYQLNSKNHCHYTLKSNHERSKINILISQIVLCVNQEKCKKIERFFVRNIRTATRWDNENKKSQIAHFEGTARSRRQGLFRQWPWNFNKTINIYQTTII